VKQSKDQNYQIHLVTRQPFDPCDEQPITDPHEAARYIVQFVKPLTREEQKRLKAMYDLQLSDYVPNLAFLEWLEPQTWKALTQDKLYRASVRYEPRDKISPRIDPPQDGNAPHLRAVLFPEFDYRDIIKVIRTLRSQSNLAETCEGNGDRAGNESDAYQIRVLDDRDSGGDLQIVFAPLPEELLRVIAQREEVRWIEKVPKIVLDAHALSEATPAGLIQSGQIGHTPLWNKGIRGERQVIGVTDTKVRLGHCMFRDPDTQHPVGQTHRKVVGNRQGSGDSDGHGHKVAGLIAGAALDRPAMNKKGMAWQARLSLDDIDSDNLFSILQNQASDGAFIHTNSWHSDADAYDQTARAVDRFVSENEEHFVCGSSGSSDESLGPPGIAKNILCVSASDEPPQALDVGDGATGPVNNHDQRRKPEICAPGCGFEAAGTVPCGTLHVADCASSWATAVIAGAAALVRQYYLEGWYPTGAKYEANGFSPSGALIKATLLNSTVAMTVVDGYPSNKAGWGRVQLTNTLFFGDGIPKLFVRDIRKAAGLHTGESHTYTVSVKDDSRLLKITLVWSDRPGFNAVSYLLVNRLDLIVTSPDGKVFFGNHFDANGISTADGETDTVNNIEMVIRARGLSGTWTITVLCAAANDSTQPQGYALVVTAALN
jgi:hypothetical protein